METITELSMYDIGVISYKLKRYITINTMIAGLCESGVVLNSVPSQTSCIVKIKEGKNIYDIKSMIDFNIGISLNLNYTDIVNSLISIGCKDPATAINIIRQRTNMLYTVLQLAEDEFNIIAI